MGPYSEQGECLHQKIKKLKVQMLSDYKRHGMVHFFLITYYLENYATVGFIIQVVFFNKLFYIKGT